MPFKLGTTLLTATTSAIALACAAPAHAQEGGSPTPPSTTALEDIVVTAQKKAENLQDVPISIAALGADTLRNANIQAAPDLPKLVPGLVFQQQAGNLNIFLRGVGNPASAIGNESSVAAYIDGVYYARLAPALFELNNVERVEVLKGPQGTLFGRNADAGLIHIITREPTQDGALKAEIGYANYQTVMGSFYGATGLGDKLAADIAVRGLKQHDGWGINQFDGSDFGKIWSIAARTKWVFTPSDRTKLVLTGDYNRSREDQGVFGTQFVGTHGNFLPPLDFVYPKLPLYDQFTDGTNQSKDESWGASLRFEQELGFGKLVATSAYRRMTGAYEADADRTPQNFFNYYGPFKQTQASQELQLSSDGGGPFSWTVGAFYMYLKTQYDPIRFSGIQWQQAFGLPQGEFQIFSRQRTNSYAAYAQGTYELAPNTNFTAGIRYTSDHVSADGHNDVVDESLGVRVNTGDIADKETFNKVTFRLSLDHRINQDLLIYGSFNRGFKAGTFNLLPLAIPAVKPEVLDAYEIGAKATLFDNRLRLNLAAFLWDVSNLQVQTFDGVSIFLLNAATARSKGIELDADAVLAEGLTGRFSVSLLDAEYKSFPGAPLAVPNPNPPFGNFPLVPHDASGNRLPDAPTVSFSVGLNYVLPTSIGEWQISGNYAYNNGHYFDPDNVVKNPKYGLLDGRLSFSPASLQGFKISIWGRNLTKERYFVSESEQGTQAGNLVVPGAPRTYGITLGYEM